MELLYKWRLEEHVKHPRHPKVIYVVDLARCPLKREFELKFPELVKHDIMSPSSVFGTLIHMGFELFLEHYAMKEGYKVVTELNLVKVINIEGEEYALSGRVDALLVSKKSNNVLVVELKTSRSDASIPYEHHVLQAQVYTWMTGASDAILIYFTPERIAEFQIGTLGRPQLSSEEIVRLVKETITASHVPRYEWECRYCKFATICPSKVTSQ